MRTQGSGKEVMRAMVEPSAGGERPGNPVDEARTAIWRLFQEGYVDEDMATAGLLAVDLGTRRAHRQAIADSEMLDSRHRD